MISFIFMCLLLPVNSVFIIKDNIIPKELRHNRNCRGGLVLSKFKPDEYVPISCANIRFQQSDKQDYVFRNNAGNKINSARTKQTEYLAVYEDGICKMNAVELQDTYMGDMYDKIHSEGNIPSLINSYGYCKEKEGHDEYIRYNRDTPQLVGSRSCEWYGYRSTYSVDGCSLHSNKIISHGNTIRDFSVPWGCVKNGENTFLNIYTEFDIPQGEEIHSYNDRNSVYKDVYAQYGVSTVHFDQTYSQMKYIFDSVGLEINEYAKPTKSNALLHAQSRYTQYIESQPPQYKPGFDREVNWRIEYNEIYFTEKFGEHYSNMSSMFGARYYKQEIEYRIQLQLMRDSIARRNVFIDADTKMRNLHDGLKNSMKTIEDEYSTTVHVNRWLTHIGIPQVRNMAYEKEKVDKCKYLLEQAHSLTLANSERIKSILDEMDYETMQNKVKLEKNYARSILYEAYVDLSNEKYNPVDLDKYVLSYPDEIRIIFGRVINGVVQIPSDYESDPRYIRYTNALNSNWVDTYDPTELHVRLLKDPVTGKNGINTINFDTVADDALQDYEPFYIDISDIDNFEVLPVKGYTYVRGHSFKIFIPETVGIPTITNDRYQSRLNIMQEMVNLENQMIEYNYHNNTELLSLHRQFISQPPLCTLEYKCQCHETQPTRAAAVAGCAEKCPKAFLHFWDQSEPRLASKILVHDRSECRCMQEALTELQCVLQGRQWINELFVSQYNMVLAMDTVRRDTQYEDTYLYCKMMNCVNGTVDEPCLYSGGVCEKGWFDGNCNTVGACDGFAYEDCICAGSTCMAGKYCTQTGVCKNIVPKDDKKLLYLNHISRI